MVELSRELTIFIFIWLMALAFVIGSYIGIKYGINRKL